MQDHEVVCIYHGGCLDGAAAAWVVGQFFDWKVRFIPAVYNKPPPQGLEGKRVFIVDFSYDRATTIYLQKICKEVVILDHHKTAAENLDGLVSIDQSHSGCMLTFQHFYPGIEPPCQLKFVEDRDLWKFKLQGTKEWTAFAFTFPLTPEGFQEAIITPLPKAIEHGLVLLRKQEGDVKRLLKSARRFVLGDKDDYLHSVLVVNCGAMHSSDVGAALSEGHRFSVTYYDNQEARLFSLRSSSGFDVSRLAKLYGGGGHPGAAGFKIDFDDPRFPDSHKGLLLKPLEDFGD